MLVNHVINFQSLLLIQKNILIKSWYEVFTCRVDVDHIINSRYLLPIDQSISLELS